MRIMKLFAKIYTYCRYTRYMHPSSWGEHVHVLSMSKTWTCTNSTGKSSETLAQKNIKYFSISSWLHTLHLLFRVSELSLVTLPLRRQFGAQFFWDGRSDDPPPGGRRSGSTCKCHCHWRQPFSHRRTATENAVLFSRFGTAGEANRGFLGA